VEEDAEGLCHKAAGLWAEAEAADGGAEAEALRAEAREALDAARALAARVGSVRLQATPPAPPPYGCPYPSPYRTHPLCS
jgi:hypothetical protein